MTPIELIKRGLQNRNWNDVSKGYELLSGELIPVEESETGNEKACSLLEHLEDSINTWVVENLQASRTLPKEPETKPKKKKTAKKKQARKRAPKKSSPPPEDDDEESEQDADPWSQFRTDLPDKNRTGYEVALAKKSEWVDEVDPEDADTKNSQLMTGNLAPAQRTRGKVKKIKRECSRCNKTFELHPDFRPRRLDKDDDPTSYICDRCLGRPSSQRNWE